MAPCYHGAMVPWCHGAMEPSWHHGTMGRKCEKFQPECCEADFGSRIKILGYPLGRSASFFELHLFRLVPGLKIDFFEKLPQVSRVQCVNVCPMLPVGVGRLFRPPPGSLFRPPPFSLGVGRLFRPLFRPPKTVPSTLIPPSTIIEGFRINPLKSVDSC